MELEILIWDVNHGNSTSVKLPNGNTIMFDCAANPITDFSPIRQTKDHWGYLDLLVVSHPHLDHISDIMNIDYLKPSLLLRPKVSHTQLRDGKYGSSEDIIEKYIDFEINYNEKPSWANNPNYNWGGDVEINHFGLYGYQEDMNDYSLVSFLTYGGFTFAYAGDLTSEGWEHLIEQEGSKFTNLLQKTNFFEVSHHGRREGFNSIIFEYMKNLKMAFISDKYLQTTSVTGSYSQYCNGWQIIDEITKESDNRKVLTTRNDGRIKINVKQFGDTTEVGVSTYDHNGYY
jgi:competence protein ComEC